MGRPPSNDDSGLKKGPWTPEEDQKLVKYIQKHGHGSWRALPKLAGLNRCGKSCRLRWTNYLRPDIKRGKFSQEEEQTILNLHAVLGNKWSAIAGHLPGRTDNEIKNFWNTHLKKKLIQMGFDPMTHRPRTDIFSSLPHLIALANLKELMEHHSWEEQAVRLQAAEAAQMATLQYLQHLLHPLPSPTSNLNTTFSDMSSESTIYNLLNSLSSMKDHDFGLGASTLQPVPHDDSIPFLHLPDLQIPCSYQTPLKNDNIIVQAPPHELTGLSQGELSSPNNSQWLASSSSTPSPSVAPPLSNLGDACSTSSYGGAAPFAWPELLLEYPLFDHEIS
ncbi:hypothetical protein FH972_002647 [Carpinus fangiana]|uniref:Uncharacterized protein n=1 Tax=Carpinus fangiana TaxID=176857 RepID=A0A5N6QHD6_9ROSI|nr:hypothetical protein FH972_002647 [Carpinus fangiana]